MSTSHLLDLSARDMRHTPMAERPSLLTKHWQQMSQGVKIVLAPLIRQSSKDQQISGSKHVSLPCGRNESFEGREQELVQLHHELITVHDEYASLRSPRPVLVHGMAGVGKTELALEYVLRHDHCFDCILWVTASTDASLDLGYAEIARYISSTSNASPVSRSAASTLRVGNVLEWLQSTAQCWLLVLDDLHDWSAIKSYWPRSGKGSILVTSRNRNVLPLCFGSELCLQPLNRACGAKLLLRLLEHSSDVADQRLAQELSDQFGGHPMAIAHMAGCIRKENLSLQEARSKYRRRDATKQLWLRAMSTSAYRDPMPLHGLWDTALAGLSEEAKSMLCQLAMLSPDNIEEDFLLSGHHGLPCKTDALKSLEALTQRQLVNRRVVLGAPVWSIHRALQMDLLCRLDGDTSRRQEVFLGIVSTIRAHCPPQSSIQIPLQENWSQVEAILAHALYIQEVYEQSAPPMIPLPELASLLGDIGSYCYERGLVGQGTKALTLAKAFHDNCAEKDDLEHSRVCTMMAGLNQESGITGRERGWHLLHLSMNLRLQHVNCRRCHNENPAEDEWLMLTAAWNDLACSFLEYSAFAAAETLLVKSLRLKQMLQIPKQGQAFYQYAENYKNMALVRVSEGRYTDALQLISDGVHLVESKLGPRTAASLTFRFHQAYIHFYMGNTKEALEQHEGVRVAREMMYGLNEAHTLSSYYACALMCFHLNRLSTARAYLEMCLRYKAAWPRENLPRVKHLLSKVLLSTGGNELQACELQDSAATMQISMTTGQTLGGTKPPMVSLPLETLYDHLVSFESGRSTIGQYEAVLPQFMLDAVGSGCESGSDVTK
ncbi:hypothetical protein F4780DRAFT_778211 [Xylariomycetidae sp. FL0641]|nr:hypothetical protein F4780DRAFT_778211 [Xylariomycetidae sp. FL0641]